MQRTMYKRPLPEGAIPFGSAEGRTIFAEALAGGELNGYFALAEQFHTQSDPSYCGLGSLVVALNALGIDPGRSWKGPWRWFAEELLDCCASLETVREQGLDLDEVACLARCNGAEAELVRAGDGQEAAWRDALMRAATGECVLIAAYDRSTLGQTGSGHFSPIGAYHSGRDLALILDVARFKYPAHWLPASRLWAAMRPTDPATGRSRGWLALKPALEGAATSCDLRTEKC